MGPTEFTQWNPSRPGWMTLAEILRKGRDIGNKLKVRDWVPLVGGTGLGELVLGRAPEGAERVGYGERLTTGKGWTTQLHPDIIELGMNVGGPALGAAKAAPTVAKNVGKAAVRAAENAMVPVSRKQVMRGAIDLGEGTSPAQQLANELRAARRPDEPIDEALLGRERRKLEALREASPASRYGLGRDLSGAYWDQDMYLQRLEQAHKYMKDYMLPQNIYRQPDWARELTQPPSQRGGKMSPAGAEWWYDRPAPPSVEAFLKAAQTEPSLSVLGTMPPHARSLEDFAEEFGERAGKRIDIEYGPGEDTPYKVKKKHERGEVMRDEYGDEIREYFEHEAGDSPMYDEYGNVVMDVDPKTGKEVPRVARGGEEMYDQYGDRQYDWTLSEGGELVRNERGNPVMIENPDYYDDMSNVTMSVSNRGGGGGQLNIKGWDTPRTQIDAMEAGRAGALMYQTLLAHASKTGKQLPYSSSGLTPDNQYRLLSNVLANYARTGINPRDVSGTTSGLRPRARGYAEGPDVWRALAGETDARLSDPEAIQFTGKGFTAHGADITPEEIGERILEFSPNVESSRVGQKSLMQNAVYKWLENATPEEAEAVARAWSSSIDSPLFGRATPGALGALAGGSTGAAALISALRNGDKPK